MSRLISNLFKGVAIGLANIIPGVSGGTMALVLGIYERLIRAVHNVNLDTALSLFRGRKVFVEEMRRVDALFLATIGIGAIGAVVGVAKLMLYLLTNHHDPTYGFFFGLVACSLLVPYRLIKKRGLGALASATIAAGLVVALSLALGGDAQVDAARRKAQIKAGAQQTTSTAGMPAKASVQRDAKTIGVFVVSGAIAISAMILPGISGSFVLLLLGVYFDLLSCIVTRDFVLLGAFAMGCLLGLLLFTRLINFLLQRYRDLTMAFLTGLVVGSLYAIWPFRQYVVVDGRRIDLHNILPATFSLNEWLAVAAAGVGAMIVAAFIVVESHKARAHRARGGALNSEASEAI